MIIEPMYKLRCETCGVIESEEKPDGLYEDHQDAALRREAHKEIKGSGQCVAIIGGVFPQLGL